MQGGFLKKFVVAQGILIVILAGVVFYVYTRPDNDQKSDDESNTPDRVITDTNGSTPPPTSSNLTKDWKTHEDEFGFSFQYPKDFTLDISRPGEYSENFPMKVIIAFPPYESANSVEFSVIKGTVKKSPNDEICQSTDTTINGVAAIKRSCGDAGSSSVSYSVQLKNQTALTLRVVHNASPEPKTIPKEITDGIVSSLTIEK